MKENLTYQTFNRGIVGRLGLARTDVEKIRLGAVIQDNFMPRVLGAMSLRAGLKYTGDTDSNNKAIHIPFIYSTTDTAIYEITNQKLRIKIDDAPITRVSVSTSITSGDMSSAAGWTDNDQAGTTSNFSGGYMTLQGTGVNSARRTQQVTVAGGDIGKEHALRIVIDRGVVILRVGSTSGADDFVQAVTLTKGTYSIAFAPTGNFHVDFRSFTRYASWVDSCTIESSGISSLTTPWVEADLPLIRHDQSGNVVYVFADKYAPYKIQRIDTGTLQYTKRSFGIVNYLSDDGPFRSINSSDVTITSSAVNGDVTLASSQPLFKSTNVGGLYRISSNGQYVETAISSADVFTDPIRISGTSANERVFGLFITGTWVGTVTLQRSLATPDNWTDVATYTINQPGTTFNDGLPNQIAYYRIGIKTGNYTSGTANVALNASQGSITGVVRITGFTNTTSVTGSVIQSLGTTTATSLWEESEWSDRRGYPTSVALYQGRLWCAGRAKIWGSVSDNYESFDDSIEGDSGTISRTIGRGPVDVINWILPLLRLAIGTSSQEMVAKSSTLDEPLTQSNVNLKDTSTQGSSNIMPARIDNTGLFVGKSGNSLFQTDYSVDIDDYTTEELGKICENIFRQGIVRLAVQRHPDTRVHCVLSDGSVVVLVYDKLENVNCFVTISTDGKVEDAFTLPTPTGDDVYYCVRRVINGSPVRYLEKFAQEEDTQGASFVYDGVSASNISVVINGIPKFNDNVWLTARDINGDKIQNVQVIDGTVTLSAPVTYAKFTPCVYALADSYSQYGGVPVDTFPGLSYLNGKSVCVFADGVDLGTFTVTGGSITLPVEVEQAVVGLPYKGRFKSVKLVPQVRSGTPLNQPKIINRLGLILSDTHALGLKYGLDFDVLDDMPLIEDYDTVDENHIWEEYPEEFFEFEGTWDTDSRVCLEAQSPRPCTILSLIIGVKTNEKNSRDE